MTLLASQGYILHLTSASEVWFLELSQEFKVREKKKGTYVLWLNIKKSVIADLTHTLHVCHYQFVFLSFTMDEKAASSIAFGVHDLTDPHTTDPASFLWEPSPAGVISGHNHSLDTHNIAVTKTTTRRMGHDNGLAATGHVHNARRPPASTSLDSSKENLCLAATLKGSPSQLLGKETKNT